MSRVAGACHFITALHSGGLKDVASSVCCWESSCCFSDALCIWLFVAVAGFLVGMELAAEFLTEQTESIRILVALAGGVLGAILGMLLQRVAFSIGGLFAGGYLGLVLAREADLPGEPLVWFVVGAILGAIVAAR